MSVSSIVTRVESLILPVSGVSAETIQVAVRAAAEHSVTERSPLVLEEDLALTDGASDLSEDLEEWVEGRSRVRAVEYPLDEIPASFLSPRQWRVRNDSTDGHTLMVEDGGTETVRVHYTVPHSVDLVADTTTMSVTEEEAAAHLAAAEILERLAARWAQKQSVAVAGTEYQGPDPGTLTRMAKQLRGRGVDLLGRPAVSFGDEPGVQPIEDAV